MIPRDDDIVEPFGLRRSARSKIQIHVNGCFHQNRSSRQFPSKTRAPAVAINVEDVPEFEGLVGFYPRTVDQCLVQLFTCDIVPALRSGLSIIVGLQSMVSPSDQ